MASSFSTADFFGNADFSDITVQFSAKSIKCHKIILCTKSEYFKKLCGPESRFKESDSGVIELFDDDQDAVEAVLRHIYTDEIDCSRPSDWLHQLHVCQASDKYLLPKLSSAAFERFKKATSDLQDMSNVLNAIQTIRDLSNNEEHIAVADSLETRHQSALLKHDDYRLIVENDKALMWKHMDRLNFADDVEMIDFVKCGNCGKSGFVPVGMPAIILGETCPSYAKQHRRLFKCLVSKASLAQLK